MEYCVQKDLIYFFKMPINSFNSFPFSSIFFLLQKHVTNRYICECEFWTEHISIPMDVMQIAYMLFLFNQTFWNRNVFPYVTEAQWINQTTCDKMFHVAKLHFFIKRLGRVEKFFFARKIVDYSMKFVYRDIFYELSTFLNDHHKTVYKWSVCVGIKHNCH